MFDFSSQQSGKLQITWLKFLSCTFDVTITNSESFLVTKDHASRAVNDLCQEIGGCHVDCLNETVTIESLSYAFKCKILSDVGRPNFRFDILRIKYESFSQKN